MNELKRPGVVGGEIRTVTNAQHGRILQLTVEQAHDTALAVFAERGYRPYYGHSYGYYRPYRVYHRHHYRRYW